MSNDPQESLDLFDEHEEIVSEDGKEVKRKGIFLLPNLLTTAALFAGFFSIVSAINGNFVYAGMGYICCTDVRWIRWKSGKTYKFPKPLWSSVRQLK